MKLLLLTGLFISSVCYGQKKDSATAKADSVQIIMGDFLLFLQDKVTVKEYIPFQTAVAMYVKSKEYIKPKK